MVETMPCPICGTQVEYAIESSPEWYRDPSLPVYRIDCHEKCRRYWLAAISDPRPQIDPAILSFLDGLNDKQRMFISESTQRVCDTGSWIIYDRSELQQLVTDYHYAKAAVMLYGWRNAAFQVSGTGLDAENRLFFVESEGTRWTLRLHQPGTSINKVRSEIYWLKALWNKAKVKTLSPILGCDGELVQCLSGNALPVRYATAYNWIPGKTLNLLSEDGKTPELIWSLGMMLGRMHAISETLKLPQWFTRPRYDIDWINLKVEKAFGKDYRYYSARDLEKLSSVSSRFSRFAAEHGEGRHVFGLIHLDLEPHNIVISETQPCPIDMVHLGFGYYISDVLSVSRCFDTDEQPIFFEGYQEIRSLPKDYRQQFALFDDIGLL